jgi:CRP/FNR family transcriptional regulator
MSKNPSITSHLMQILSDDLKKAEHKITDLAQKPVRERMAEAILFIKETYGYEKDNATINVILTREELANIVGTATETAIRLLSELRQEKIIDFVGKKIKILNHTKLTELANVND